MLACGALVAAPLVALPGGGTPQIALTANLTAMAMARAALTDTVAINGRVRVNATLRSPAGFVLRGVIHTQNEARVTPTNLLFARIAVNIHPIGETFVIRLVPEARLPLFSPFQNVFWPGSS